jgi:hypothetical protein
MNTLNKSSLYSLIPKHMKKIISISLIAILIVAGWMMYPSQKTSDGTVSELVVDEIQDDTVKYNNVIELTQENLQLHKEVIQYEITFGQDDVVDVSWYLYVSYIDETITSVYCLLTDGAIPLLEPRILWFIPERKYSLVTPKIRLSIGKFWMVNILNDKEGRIRIGSAFNDSGSFEVNAGDTWYLTLAVPTSAEKSGFSVLLNSMNSSMHIRQLTRKGTVDFFSANYNQFSGKYYAVKLLLLGGCSICDVNKEITTLNGTILNVYVVGHRKGSMQVILPDGQEKLFDQKGLMIYKFLGNETGTWKFFIEGWSLYFRMQVVLMYIDIDPHVRSVSM